MIRRISYVGTYKLMTANSVSSSQTRVYKKEKSARKGHTRERVRNHLVAEREKGEDGDTHPAGSLLLCGELFALPCVVVAPVRRLLVLSHLVHGIQKKFG